MEIEPILERGRTEDRAPLCDDRSVRWLALLLLALPFAEIVLLVAIGRQLGLAGTVALLVLTGLLGALVARIQGVGVVRKVQSELAAGRLPAGELVDGVLLLLAGFLLILPGVLSDGLAFFCLLPAGRRLLKGWLRRGFERGMRRGGVSMSFGFDGGFPPREPPRNITPREPQSPGAVSERKALGGADER